MNDTDSNPKLVRIGEHTYHLAKRADGAGMELVRAHPDDVLDEDAERRRVEAVSAYGGYRSAPRAGTPANINQPLDKRTETVLSHEADAETRARLNGGIVPRANRGRR
ncbi:MAG: hypothetical protein KDI42_00310 [Gammaproteobacteria bacterium]|nr:hypothetical protein [Gammaproteobacteria bacterium]